MRDFKKGDKVLLGAVVDNVNAHFYTFNRRSVPISNAFNPVQAHPGVPVADLVEECEKARAVINALVSDGARVYRGGANPEDVASYYALRADREAAKEPKEIAEPNWKVLCRRLWNEAKGGYDKVRPEYVVPIVEEINDWIEQEALRGTEDGLPEKP